MVVVFGRGIAVDYTIKAYSDKVAVYEGRGSVVDQI
jgi:hypothetical protein